MSLTCLIVLGLRMLLTKIFDELNLWVVSSYENVPVTKFLDQEFEISCVFVCFIFLQKYFFSFSLEMTLTFRILQK